MVKINGISLDVAGQTIADYLVTTDYNLSRIAVERNGEIVPKSTYDKVVMQEGDTMVKINGENLEIAGQTLGAYLSTTNYSLSRIAVERNGEIVPKSEYNNVILCNGDAIEIVSFVGGG